MKQQAIDLCKENVDKNVDSVRAELKAFVDEKYKVMLRVMR